MRETGSATVSCTVGPVQCAQIVILLAIGSDQSRGALRPGGVDPARCAPFIGLLAIGFGQSRGAPRSGGVGEAQCARIVALLAIGPGQSRGVQRSGGVDPARCAQIAGFLAIGLGQWRGALRSGGVGPAGCAQIAALLASGFGQSRGVPQSGEPGPARRPRNRHPRIVGLLQIGLAQSRGVLRSGGTGPARCGQLTELLAIGSAQSRGAPRSGSVARPGTLRSPHSLRSALASLEEPYGLEGSAGPIRSDRRTPCDRPRAISRSPTIRTGPPGPREASLISCTGVWELRRPDPLQNPRTTGPGAENAATARDTRNPAARGKGEKP